MTIEQVKVQNGISDECRAAISSVLSSTQTNYKGKIDALGNEKESGTNKPLLYIHGITSAGSTLGLTDFQGATIKATTAGVETTLAANEFTVTAVSAGPTILSLAVVNDYSLSMRDQDLDLVREIETDLFTYLPAVYEAEVVYFSSIVSKKLAYTTTQASILNAAA